MKRRVVTKEIGAEIIAVFNETNSIKQTAQRVSFSTDTVRRTLKKSGVQFIDNSFKEDELKGIINDYQNGMTLKELGEKYNRNDSSILHKLQDIGIYKRLKHRFSTEELEDIILHYPSGDYDYIFQKYPFLTKKRLFTLMSKNNIHRENYYWEESEINFLKECSKNGMTIIEIYDAFNRKYSITAIQCKMGKLNLLKKITWTDEEIEILKNYYSKVSIDQVCDMIPNHNRKSIIERACELGIKSIYSVDKPIQISRLHDYIRGNNSYWINASIKNCNNKCIITGDDEFEIHHVYSVNKMILEALEYCDIPNSPSIVLSTDDKKRVLNVFQSIQNSHPLGVCIHPDIHKAFHKEYGYGDNTEAQWDIFISRYNY